MVEQIFEAVLSRFDSEKMGGLTTSVQFNLSGDEGGTYHLNIADGDINYGEGAAENPEATLSMTAEDFQGLSSGDLNPMMAFMQGKIKVDGNMSTVMNLQSLLTG